MIFEQTSTPMSVCFRVCFAVLYPLNSVKKCLIVLSDSSCSKIEAEIVKFTNSDWQQVVELAQLINKKYFLK